MSQKQISFARRIIQANERLNVICHDFYRSNMSEEEFRAERAEILKFIDDAGREMKQILKKPLEKTFTDDEITGEYPSINF